MGLAPDNASAAIPHFDSSFRYYHDVVHAHDKEVYAAICYTGAPRAPALTFMNQKTSFLNSIGQDYVSLAYTVPDLHFYELFLFKPAMMIVQPQTYINLTVKGHFTKSADRMQAWMQQIYGIYQCNEMRKEYEKKNNVVFSWLVRARFDLWFKHPLKDLGSLDPSKVHIPADFGGEQGLNDRFAWIPRKYMDAYAGQFLEVEWYRGKLTPEMFLRSHLEKSKVPVELHEDWKISLMREQGVLAFA